MDTFLNVWQYKSGLRWTLNPINWWEHLRVFFRRFKWASQRATRGFCDLDCWEMDTYYTHLLINSLTHFRDNTSSYPDRCNSLDEWKNELTHMIEEFVLSIDETKYSNNYIDEWENMPRDVKPDSNKAYWDYIRRQYIEVEKTNAMIMRQHRALALTLLNKSYDDLWD